MAVDHIGSLAEAGVTVRPYAGAGDIASVQAVRAEVRRADGDLWLPGPDTGEEPDGVHPFCLVAQADSGRTVGFTWMDWWSEGADTRVYLLSGCVAPAWRRRGIGTAMLRWLAEAGVSTARLSTVAENPNNSVRLYEKAGYRVTARQPRYRKPVEAC
ncbi:GNAT family N-acetyltransferase [Micromonospora sp. DT231]|uniref:GNAT family N-acetyltransferase n=1 Tax=Micromonospora sp. DT231 TaxID=3416526 RepID=UPI003CEB27E6